jgi:phage-related protein
VAIRVVTKKRTPILGVDIVYKYLYILSMANEDPKSRLKWEGDSLEEIRTWSADARANIGADLRRLQEYKQPLDSKSMGKSLPGIRELRDQDKDFWYRLLYALHSGWIYVLHCFKKTTNQTSQKDIQIAKDRLRDAKARKDEPFVKEADEEEKSA